MLNNSAFDIDLDALVIQLMPIKLRTTIHNAWLRFLIWPFKQQLNALKTYRADTIYKLTHSTLVGSIEQVLNDGFDKVERRIRIKDGVKINALYIYTQVENKPVYLPKTIYTAAELAEIYSDFIVSIPMALGLTTPDIDRLKYLTRYYCADDKTFKIELI